jgi:hypothetical protein
MYRGRRAVVVENTDLRVTLLEDGGHIAEIFDKETAVNPLWTPEWASIEPSTYDRDAHPEYGDTVEASLLAGIMGHNVCLDIFGGPSPEEAAAGMPVHGETSIARFDISEHDGRLTMRTVLPLAELRFERRVDLHGRAVRIHEAVENLSGTDRPIGWTEHVTLGPPFLEKGATAIRASATRSKVFEKSVGGADYLKAGAMFDWPMAPRADEGSADLRLFTSASSSSAYTAHLMDPDREHAFFVAFSPASHLAFGYVWKRRDFPWLGIWEENHSRPNPPWSGRTLTCGMEFGVSPMPESRRQMIDRGRLFDVPGYRWIPARSRVEVEYWARTERADTVPLSIDWPR